MHHLRFQIRRTAADQRYPPRDWLATARRTLELSEAEAKRFLSGERPECADGKRSWTLLTWNRLPVGFCKLS